MAKKKKKSQANTTDATTVDAMPPADYPMIPEDEPLPPPDDSEPSAPEDAPVLSPYTSPTCRVYFRNKIPFFVPRDLLCNASELLGALVTLPSDEPQNELDDIHIEEPQDELNDIHIEEVPDDAGHVLVHYLYTGTWQTLSQSHSQQEPPTCYDSNISVIKSDFETSVHVYCAAKAYGLPALVGMAKKELLRLANYLTPLDVVVSASEACQLLSEHDIWFRSFLQRRLRLMFNTSKYLDDSVFLGCVQHGTVYSNFLVKSMFLLCCQNSRNRRILPVADVEQSDFETDEAHLNGSAAAAEVPADDHFSVSQDEPPAEETKVPETPPSDDSWGLLTKKQKKKKKKSEKTIVSEQEKELEPEAVPEAEADPWALGELPKPKKKKKEKKVEGGNKKKNKDQEIVPDAPNPESGTEPGAETSTMTVVNPWGFLPKKMPLMREQMIMPDLGCPDRVTHILGGGWTECSACREQVGNISAEFQANQTNEGERLLF
ncbi:hypothetical protein CGCSCA1_v015012 [Colletotrichum siamense]|nr:hypothetical protein CGCSCA1_v015012 [Colletotrichum siamense]